MQAAFKAMEEIGFAIIAITLSLVAVFIPLAFQTTTTGRLFIEFAFALAGSVVISAFVALSLTPMMAARILRPIEKEKHGALFLAFDRWFNALNRFYGRSLGWCLAARVGRGGGGRGLALAHGPGLPGLDKEFLPEEDSGMFICFAVAPEGSTSEYTDRMVQQMDRIIAEIPEIRSRGSMVAPPFGGPGQANQGIAFVRLHAERERSVQDIVTAPGGLRMRLFTEVEGAMIIPNIPKAIGRSFGAPFQLVLQHQDLDALNTTALALANKLRTNGFLINVRSTFEVNKPELRLRHRPQPRGRAGRVDFGHFADAADSVRRAGPQQDQGRREGVRRDRAARAHVPADAARSGAPVRPQHPRRPHPTEQRGELPDRRRPERHRPLRPVAERDDHGARPWV